MTIEQANSYFEALPDGFASTDQLRAALPASAQKVSVSQASLTSFFY